MFRLRQTVCAHAEQVRTEATGGWRIPLEKVAACCALQAARDGAVDVGLAKRGLALLRAALEGIRTLVWVQTLS